MNKTIPLDPRSWGIELSISSAACDRLPTKYSDDINLTIRRKGQEDCDDIVYPVLEDAWPRLKFKFDEQIFKLRRGRYIGIISIGCEVVDCVIEWFVGQNLCITDIEALDYNDLACAPDATTIDNPNCIQCEKPVNHECSCEPTIVVGDTIQFKYEFTDEVLGCCTFKMKQVEVPTC